jgi:ATP-dependent DNA helicase DinG
VSDNKNMKSYEYNSFFPYPSIRDQQKVAIEFAIDSFLNNDKRFCIVEAGTGVGKSAIGLTVARALADNMPDNDLITSGSYFITTQKILQQQYVDDFKSVVSLKSSSNYQCSFKKSNTCSESQQALRTAEKSSKFFKKCFHECVYKKQKQRFLDSAESITNFSYFLTEANLSGKIVPRQVLVIDEGHNIESALSKFVEVGVSEFFVKSILGVSFPKNMTQFRAYKWIEEKYLPMVKKKVSHFEKMIDQFGGEKFREKLAQFQKITKQHDLLKGHFSKLQRFVNIYDRENWVFDLEWSDVKGYKRLSFKPIDVSQYSEDVLFKLGVKVLILSATILNRDTFCKTLGISRSDSSFLTLPSPFPSENRPVIFSPVGSMSAKVIDRTLPKLTNAVREILEHHKNEKGIIHCKTFKIAKYLNEHLKDTRVLIHDSSNRDRVLNLHLTSDKPTVLLSPSMSEGVDLKGDTSRFQIICKVPYPYLGDKLIRKRMNRVKGWYELQTAKLIVQSAGRSVRSVEDYATTYILDSDFDRFLNKASDMFSEDFKKCIIQ